MPVSAAVRDRAGLVAGDGLVVDLELDHAPRVVDVPADLAAALYADTLAEAFEQLSPSNRKRHVLSVESAKTQETRQRRIAKVLMELR